MTDNENMTPETTEADASVVEEVTPDTDSTIDDILDSIGADDVAGDDEETDGDVDGDETAVDGDAPKKNNNVVVIAVVAAVVAIAAIAGAWYFMGGKATSLLGAKAATVGDSTITIAQLDAEIAKLKLQQPNIFDTENGGMEEGTVRKSMLDELINQELISQEAKKQGVTVSDEDIDKQIESLKSSYGGDEKFNEALESAGYTMESLKQMYQWQMLGQGLIEKLVTADSITDEDAKKYYDENKDSFKTEAGKKASHILFKEDDKATAEKVLKEIKDGGDFEALAKEHSQDPGSAENGGDLGFPTSAYVEEFQAALDKLKKGQMSGLVKTEYGYHIIKVTDTRKAGQQTFEEVKDQIKQQLLSTKQSEAYQALLTDLRGTVKIVILDPVVLEAEKKAAEAPAEGGAPAGMGETTEEAPAETPAEQPAETPAP